MAKRSTGTKRDGGKAHAGGPADPIDAALTLAAQQGWRHTSLADIATAAHMPIAELYRLYPSKIAILAAFMRRSDLAMLQAGGGDTADEGPRDRLFDVIMRRLDVLQPHRDGLRSVLRDTARDPAAAFCGLARPGRQTLAWMLETAGIESDGLVGRLRQGGLGLIYADTLRVWLTDDSPDLAKTMASLDRRLRRAESLVRALPGRRRKVRATEAASDSSS
jgi:AcrR family transcriptional regulator